MDFEKLKTQINETQKTINKEIDPSSPSKGGLEMAKNQAINTLQQLRVLEKTMIKNYSHLYLVVGAKEKLLKVFESEGCIVIDHLFLARKVANQFWPQFRPGTSLNSFLVQQINKYMDDLASNIGLNNAMRPHLIMDMTFGNAVQNEEELALTLEAMFEKQLTNLSVDKEGQILQALMACEELMKNYSEIDKLRGDVTFVVSVPSLSTEILDAYKNLLSSNIYTATFKSGLDLNNEKKVLETVKTVLRKNKENKED